jgi:hypothetical protein
MKRVLTFLSRLRVWQVWLFFAIPAVTIAAILADYFSSEIPYRIAFYGVPGVGLVIFFILPAVLRFFPRLLPPEPTPAEDEPQEP